MRYALKLITPAASELVMLAEAKRHLLVVHDDDDAYIERLALAAASYCQQYTQRQFLTATYRLSLDRFPTEGDRLIYVPRSPLQTVSSFTYVDTAGVTQTLASSKYLVDSDSEPGRISETPDETWPDTRTQLNSVQISFIAGYGLVAAVPDDIIHAQLLMIGHLYENREAAVVGSISSEVKLGVEALLNPYRVGIFT